MPRSRLSAIHSCCRRRCRCPARATSPVSSARTSRRSALAPRAGTLGGPDRVGLRAPSRLGARAHRGKPPALSRRCATRSSATSLAARRKGRARPVLRDACSRSTTWSWRRRRPLAMKRVALAAAVARWARRPSLGHEIRPGYLELRESPDGSYELLWKKPAGGEIEIRIAPVIPDGCQLVDSRPAADHAGLGSGSGDAPMRGRDRGKDAPRRGARDDRHRRAHPHSPRGRPGREPPPSSLEPDRDAGSDHHGGGAGSQPICGSASSTSSSASITCSSSSASFSSFPIDGCW